jgi:hypothetical protein
MTEMPVASPCVRNCCLDDEDVCLGCHRSVEEIMAWGMAGNAERRAILQRAAERAEARRRRYPPSFP